MARAGVDADTDTDTPNSNVQKICSREGELWVQMDEVTFP